MPDSEVCVLCVADIPHPETELCISDAETANAVIADVVSKMGRPVKDGSDMLDAESTGRKRAAELLPTETLNAMICEWALLKEAGGGIHPIKGCHGNKATDRHHGPNKNTLYNERKSNLHGICSFCHNLWHAKNDATYEGERPKDDTPWYPEGQWQEHNPDGPKMTIQEALLNELTRYSK